MKDEISIFGGTGFIGSRFCELSKRDCVKIARADRKPETKDALYFISTTSNYNVFSNTKIDIETNLIVLMEVLEEFKESGGVFNFVSSWFVYGSTDLPARETAHCDPKGFYSITKYAAEKLLVSFCETFDIKYRILRLSNVYGASDKGVSKKKNALQFLINEMKHDRPIGLYENGNFYRDYLHVDDVCRAIDLCIDQAPVNTIINVGSGEKILFKDIIEIARSHLNSKSTIFEMDPPRFHSIIQVKDFYMDVSKLAALGFERQIGTKQGIEQLCVKD
jgi:nucleoside-diphosphate-sugar epimerase